MLTIDLKRTTCKWCSRREQLARPDVLWMGTVIYNGPFGALGLCADGHFYMFRRYLDPLCLDTDAVIAALMDER